MIEKLENLLPVENLDLDGISLFNYIISISDMKYLDEMGIAAASGCVSCNNGGGCVGPSGIINYEEHE